MRWIVSGAERDSGQDRQFIIEADDKEGATRIATQRGILVADVQNDSSDVPAKSLNELADAVQASRSKETRVVTYATQKRERQAGRINRYRNHVGRRSFIYQMILLVWTIMYALWLISIFVAVGAQVSALPRFPAMPGLAPTFSFVDLTGVFAGLMSGWMGLFVGWAIVGLPVGIAAVAVMEDNKA